MDTRQEHKLIRRVQRYSDRVAADELVRFYYREIYAFAYKQTGNIDLAMDLTQETFIAVLQSIVYYDAGKAGFRTWLYRIASNKIVDYFRSAQYKRQSSMIDLESIVIPSEESVEESYMDEELKRQAVDAIAELPFDSQQILRLKVYAEYTFVEIAKVLSIPESTIKTKYYSALKQLRRRVM